MSPTPVALVTDCGSVHNSNVHVDLTTAVDDSRRNQ